MSRKKLTIMLVSLLVCIIASISLYAFIGDGAMLFTFVLMSIPVLNEFLY